MTDAGWISRRRDTACGNFHPHSTVLSLEKLAQTFCPLLAALRRFLSHSIGQVVKRLANFLEMFGQMIVLEEFQKLDC